MADLVDLINRGAPASGRPHQPDHDLRLEYYVVRVEGYPSLPAFLQVNGGSVVR
jgi:hypothetical protein